MCLRSDIKVQSVKFMGIYWQNMAEMEYNSNKYIFISVSVFFNIIMSCLYLQRAQVHVALACFYNSPEWTDWLYI